MPRPKADTVRVRVTFPSAAYERLERLADALAMDVGTLIRVLTSVQLVQWEAMYLHPEQLAAAMSAAESGVTAQLERSAAGLFPELEEPESKSQPAARPGRSAPGPSPIEKRQTHGEQWTGYMRGL